MFKDIFFKTLDFIIKANFAVAVILILASAVFALTDNQVLFADNTDLEEMSELYGPLLTNLQLVVVYMGLGEGSVVSYCLARQKQNLFLGVGIFYLMMIGGLAFYGKVNQVPIDENYSSFFLYQGLSHILYGGYYLYLFNLKKAAR